MCNYDCLPFPCFDPPQPKGFKSLSLDIDGLPPPYCSPLIKIAYADTISIIVQNTGTTPLRVQLQISPNELDFIDDAQTLIVAPGEMGCLTPYYFSKYVRVCLFAEDSIPHVYAKIYCQMQLRM